jgi:hypothetical protein
MLRILPLEESILPEGEKRKIGTRVIVQCDVGSLLQEHV